MRVFSTVTWFHSDVTDPRLDPWAGTQAEGQLYVCDGSKAKHVQNKVRERQHSRLRHRETRGPKRMREKLPAVSVPRPGWTGAIPRQQTSPESRE